MSQARTASASSLDATDPQEAIGPSNGASIAISSESEGEETVTDGGEAPVPTVPTVPPASDSEEIPRSLPPARAGTGSDQVNAAAVPPQGLSESTKRAVEECLFNGQKMSKQARKALQADNSSPHWDEWHPGCFVDPVVVEV